jgi:hypothetical protein
MIATTQTVHYILAQKKGVVNPLLHIQLLSSKDVTRLKLSLNFVIHEIPNMLALIDTIGHCITEAIDECIETRFGGVGLPTAIKYLQEVVTNKLPRSFAVRSYA